MRRLTEQLESRRLLNGYQIELVLDGSVNATVAQLFQQAANRWQQVITGDLPNVGSGAWGGAVDDLRIRGSVVAIDGAGGGIAQARPTHVRSGTQLPIAGEIQIDSADIATLTNNGTLAMTILHEMAHVMGYGTIWNAKGGLTSGVGGSNPLFIGSNALREYRTLSGQSGASGVPLENTGGTGTRDVHWRETTFDRELMTGFLQVGSNPLSRVTIGQFQDLGYTVNYAAADSFTLPGTPPPTVGATIRGRVWNDVNRNRSIDSGEAGVSGRTIYLDRNNNSVLDASETRVTTDASGNYVFTNLPAATYKIRQVLPSGWIQTQPSNNFGNDATVSGTQVAQNLNFGTAQNSVTPPPPPTVGATIRGRVWNDANRNQSIDSGEAGVSGRTIYLDQNNNSVLDASETRVTTDASGNYVFTNLPAATYKIRQVLPSGWIQTQPTNNFGNNATVSGTQVAQNLNFGTAQNSVTPPPPPPTVGATIRGRVWNDANRNRSIDSGEAGVSGRTIYLDQNNNSVLDASEARVTTDASGNYVFTNLPASTYKIRQVLPSGWIQTQPSNNFGLNAILSSTQVAEGLNFGTVQTSASGGAVFGRLFIDENRNGWSDASEPGVEGISVWLDLDNDRVWDSTEPRVVSDRSGGYRFESLFGSSLVVRAMVDGQEWVQHTPPVNGGSAVTPGPGGRADIGFVRPRFGTANQIRSGEDWRDTSGNLIRAQAGSILYHQGFYYWFGERHNEHNPQQPIKVSSGFTVYRSSDLVNWQYRGMSLPAAPVGSGSDIAYGAVIERPRVIYNTQTRQFVMWFHVDDAPAYAYARAGVAVSNSPEGPYTYLGSVRPMGYESRDITVFRDDDGTGWLVYITAVNGDSNKAIRIAKLTPDYLGFTGEAVQFQDVKKREAPTVMKRNGVYYLWTSGANWWNPTAAKVHRATSMLGPWTDLGNPAVGVDSHITFNSQGTHVMSIAGRPDRFMFMGDRWNGNYLPSSRYVWLPIRWDGDRPRIDSPTPWNPYPEFI